MLTGGGLWTLYHSTDEQSCDTLGRLVSLHDVLCVARLRELDDVEFYGIHRDIRFCFGNHLACYFHLLALRDMGRLVHVVREDEAHLQVDFARVCDNVRLLCFIIFHVMRMIQKEVKRRAQGRPPTDDEIAHVFADEDVTDETEMRWMFRAYSKWCTNFTHKHMMEADLIVCVVQYVQKWSLRDASFMMMMGPQLLLLKHTLGFNVDVVMHVERPVDMAKNVYPTMELLAYYESRMRGSGGAEYRGVIMHGGYGSFPQFERSNSF